MTAIYLALIASLLRLEAIALHRLALAEPRNPMNRNRRARSLILSVAGTVCALAILPALLVQG